MKFKTQKFKYTCGVLSVINAIKYLGGATPSEKKLTKSMRVSTKFGAQNYRLVEAAHKLGYKTIEICPGSLKKLHAYTSKACPVIVEYLGQRGGHYAVVISVTKSHIVLIDSAMNESNQLKVWHRSAFLKRWHSDDTNVGKRLEHWMLVVSPE